MIEAPDPQSQVSQDPGLNFGLQEASESWVACPEHLPKLAKTLLSQQLVPAV